MTENAFRTWFTKWLKSAFGASVYIQKNHGSVYSAGLPDLQVCLYGAWYCLELKRNYGIVTPLQSDTMRRIQASGGSCGVVRYFEKDDTIAFLTHEEVLVWSVERSSLDRQRATFFRTLNALNPMC